MLETTVLNLTKEALFLVLILSMPPIIVASVSGLLVSLLQALTQIQEQTLSFAIKLISVTITIALTATWLGGEIFLFAKKLFDSFPTLVS
jgi:type III secretion protein S